MMKYSFPTTYGEECIIIALDKALIPLVAGALKPFEQSYTWVSDQDYEQGYNAFAQLQASLMNNCLADLVESNRQIYRLLDTVMNGTAYAAAPDPLRPGQFVVSPAIPPAPPLAIPTPGLGQDPGLRRQLLDAQGIINAGWFGIGGQKATLADVVEALRIGTPQDAERIDTALEALSAASSAANVFGIVRQLLADVVDTGLEGATLGTLIASTIANAATQGVISNQLNKLLVALTGYESGDTNGNPLIPTMIWQAQNTRARIQEDAETLTARLDSILLKLDNLNLNNDELTPYIDQVEELLGDIRTLLQ